MAAATSYTPRVAIVTGAARGIGRVIALRLADDGLDVAVTDLPSKQKELDAVVEEITSRKRRGLAVVGNVTVEADVQNVVKVTVEMLGGLDVVRTLHAECVGGWDDLVGFFFIRWSRMLVSDGTAL